MKNIFFALNLLFFLSFQGLHASQSLHASKERPALKDLTFEELIAHIDKILREKEESINKSKKRKPGSLSVDTSVSVETREVQKRTKRSPQLTPTKKSETAHPQEDLYVRATGAAGLGLSSRKRIKVGEIVGYYAGEIISDEEAQRREDKNLPEVNYYLKTDYAQDGGSSKDFVINGYDKIFKTLKPEDLSSRDDFKKAGAGHIDYLTKNPSLASFANHRTPYHESEFAGLLESLSFAQLTKKLTQKGVLKKLTGSKYLLKISEDDLLSLDLSQITSDPEKQVKIKTLLLSMNGYNAKFETLSREGLADIFFFDDQGKQQKLSKSLVIRALRDIEANEEICIDYGDAFGKQIFADFSSSLEKTVREKSIYFDTTAELKTFEEFYEFTYKTLKNKPITVEIPKEALIIIYYGLSLQMKKSMSDKAEDLDEKLKKTFLPNKSKSSAFYKDFNFKKILSLVPSSLQKEARAIFEHIGEEGNLEKAISFFIENFNILTPFYRNLSTVTLQSSTTEQEQSILAQLLTFRFINPEDREDTLDWPFTKGFTEELLKQVNEKCSDEFLKLLTGSSLSARSLQRLKFPAKTSETIASKLMTSFPRLKGGQESLYFPKKKDFEEFLSQIKAELQKLKLNDLEQNKLINLIMQEVLAVNPSSGDSLLSTIEKIGFAHLSETLLASIDDKGKKLELLTLANPKTGDTALHHIVVYSGESAEEGSSESDGIESLLREMGKLKLRCNYEGKNPFHIAAANSPFYMSQLLKNCQYIFDEKYGHNTKNFLHELYSYDPEIKDLEGYKKDISNITSLLLEKLSPTKVLKLLEETNDDGKTVFNLIEAGIKNPQSSSLERSFCLAFRAKLNRLYLEACMKLRSKKFTENNALFESCLAKNQKILEESSSLEELDRRIRECLRKMEEEASAQAQAPAPTQELDTEMAEAETDGSDDEEVDIMTVPTSSSSSSS